MTEQITITRTTWWMSLETGELFETHADAVAHYNEGNRVQVMYYFEFGDGTYSPWNYGPIWEH